MITLLFQPWGILTMTNETGAKPGLTAPWTGEQPPADSFVVQRTDVAPVAQILTPAPAKPAQAQGLIRIAGLGSLVQGVRDQISGLRTEIPALQESAAALRLTVSDLKQQIDAAHADVKFEAETLGNGSGS